MLFTSLNGLQATHKSINMTIQFTAEGMVLVVKPELKEGAKEAMPQLAAPFVLRGTAQELDADFAGAFAGDLQQRQTLAEQIQAQSAAQQKAAEEAKKVNKPSKYLTGKASKSALDTALEGGSDVEDESSEEGGVPETAPTLEPKQPAGPITADDLFGE